MAPFFLCLPSAFIRAHPCASASHSSLSDRLLAPLHCSLPLVFGPVDAIERRNEKHQTHSGKEKAGEGLGGFTEGGRPYGSGGMGEGQEVEDVLQAPLLEGKANVHRPPTNCSSTGNGLRYLKSWLGVKKWDVIHFNGIKYLETVR